MKTLSKEDYQTLRKNAVVLASDGHGDKVLMLNNGKIMKLFRRKRLFSSALIYPYGKRFADNVQQLSRKGIPTVKGVSLYRIPSISRIAVVYKPLDGKSLDDLIKKGVFGEDHIRRFGAFLAKLHNQGIYFRSIHLGNVIETPDGGLGLIDVSDMKTYRRSLPASLCARNMRHLCRYHEHVAAIFPNTQKELFLKTYLEALDINEKKKSHFEAIISAQLEKYWATSS